MKTHLQFLFGRTAVLMLLSSIIYLGCSNSSSSGPSGVSWHQPGAGSSFTLKDYILDSLGNTGAPRLEVDAFVATGLSIGGKSNVSQVLETSGGSSFAFYINYGPAGDFLIGDSSFSIPGGIDWVEYPTGSQRTVIILDTSYSDSIFQSKEKVSMANLGTESTIAAGKNFNAIKIKYEFTYSYSSSLSSASESGIYTEYIWFVPEIGYIGKAETHDSSSYTDEYGYTSSSSAGGRYILDSYVLK